MKNMKKYIKDCIQAMDKIDSFLYYSYDPFCNFLELNHICSTTEKILHTPLRAHYHLQL